MLENFQMFVPLFSFDVSISDFVGLYLINISSEWARMQWHSVSETVELLCNMHCLLYRLKFKNFHTHGTLKTSVCSLEKWVMCLKATVFLLAKMMTIESGNIYHLLHKFCI